MVNARVAAALALLGALTANVVRGDIVFTHVAHSGMPAPGTSTTFGGFAPPSLRDGNVGFLGFLFGSRGIFSTVGGLHADATYSTPIPGGSGNFGYYGDSSFDGTHSAIWRGRTFSGATGVYANVGSLHAVADTNTSIPDGSGKFTGAATPAIRAGSVAFLGYGPGGFSGVYSTVGGLHRVADTTMTVPEGGGTFAGFHFQWLDFDGQSVFFRATSTGGVNGIYTDAGGTLHAVVRAGDAKPGGGVFGDIAEPSADEGALAFTYVGAHSVTGIATDYGGTMSIVVDDNTMIPGRSHSFNSGVGLPALDDGNVAFQGSWITQTTSGHGIYVRYNGQLLKIIDTEDTLGGKPIGALNISNESFEGNQVAFQVQFEDATEAVYVATLPEPAMAAVLLLAALALPRRSHH